jgi:serine/threonine-protein kinase
MEAEARFCGECGASATPDDGVAAAAPTTAATFEAVFEPIQAAPAAQLMRDEEWLRPARRGINPGLVVGFIALMVLAAGATVLLLRDDSPGASSGTSATTVAAVAAATTVPATTDPGATTSVATDSTAATTTSTTVSLPPDQQLAATRDADHESVEAMVGRWVPQLSAKKAGTIDDGTTYDLAAIVAFHQQLRTEYGALLLFSGDYTYQTTDLWVSVAPESFGTAQGALAWCVAEDIGRDDCFAKLITHDPTITDSVQMQP